MAGQGDDFGAQFDRGVGAHGRSGVPFDALHEHRHLGDGLGWRQRCDFAISLDKRDPLLDNRLASGDVEQLGLEIGGGLGPMKGTAWRIGLMGAGATERNVTLCLAGLASALAAQGLATGGDPQSAATAVFAD